MGYNFFCTISRGFNYLRWQLLHSSPRGQYTLMMLTIKIVACTPWELFVSILKFRQYDGSVIHPVNEHVGDVNHDLTAVQRLVVLQAALEVCTMILLGVNNCKDTIMRLPHLVALSMKVHCTCMKYSSRSLLELSLPGGGLLLCLSSWESNAMLSGQVCFSLRHLESSTAAFPASNCMRNYRSFGLCGDCNSSYIEDIHLFSCCPTYVYIWTLTYHKRTESMYQAEKCLLSAFGNCMLLCIEGKSA